MAEAVGLPPKYDSTRVLRCGNFAQSVRPEQSRDIGGIASLFFPKAAEFNSTPWNLAASFDFAFPQTRGSRPPGTEERARYFAALDRLQLEDSEVQRVMTEVFQLVQPLSVLQQEPFRSRALGGSTL
jgi:hypothetical protein